MSKLKNINNISEIDSKINLYNLSYSDVRSFYDLTQTRLLLMISGMSRMIY